MSYHYRDSSNSYRAKEIADNNGFVPDSENNWEDQFSYDRKFSPDQWRELVLLGKELRPVPKQKEKFERTLPHISESTKSSRFKE